MSEIRAAQRIVAAEIIVEEAMEVAGLRGGHPGPPPAWMDPFLAIDHFVMREPSIRPHPHAGFSAVTVLFEDSPGAFLNRDSLGTVTTIEPGGVHWTQAGSGIIHEERPSHPPEAGHGAQIFVDLPPDLEEAPPKVHHLEPAQVPVVDVAGGRVRVLAGSFGRIDSPLRPDSDVTLLDVTLPAGVSTIVPAAAQRSAFVLVIRGDGFVGAAGEEQPLPPDHAVGFGDAHGDAVRIAAGDDGLQFIFGGGYAAAPTDPLARWRGHDHPTASGGGHPPVPGRRHGPPRALVLTAGSGLTQVSQGHFAAADATPTTRHPTRQGGMHATAKIARRHCGGRAAGLRPVTHRACRHGGQRTYR